MLGSIAIVAICFGGYKLYKYLKENTDINVSPKGIIIGIGVVLLGLMKLGNISQEKNWKANSTQYTCKKCGRTIRTIFNPAVSEKDPCSGGGQHRWMKS